MKFSRYSAMPSRHTFKNALLVQKESAKDIVPVLTKNQARAIPNSAITVSRGSRTLSVLTVRYVANIAEVDNAQQARLNIHLNPAMRPFRSQPERRKRSAAWATTMLAQ